MKNLSLTIISGDCNTVTQLFLIVLQMVLIVRGAEEEDTKLHYLPLCITLHV